METPTSVANFFLKKGYDGANDITPMKLVKLVYIAHGWHLAVIGDPLFEEPVQAWQYGPVIESLYYQTKSYRKDPIPGVISRDIVNLSADKTVELLNKVWDVYGTYDGLQLSTLTHQNGTPWDIIWNKNGGKDQRGAIIPNALIKEHYLNKLNSKKN